MLRLLFSRFLKVVKWFAIGSVLLVLLLRVVPPPFTALMVERKIESWFDGEPIDLQRTLVPWDEISDELKVAVMAGKTSASPSTGALTSARSRRRSCTTSAAVRFAAPAP